MSRNGISLAGLFYVQWRAQLLRIFERVAKKCATCNTIPTRYGLYSACNTITPKMCPSTTHEKGTQEDPQPTPQKVLLEEPSNLFAKDGFLCLRNAVGNSGKPKLREWLDFANAYFENCFQLLYDSGHTEFPSHCREIQTATNSSGGETPKPQYAMGLGVKHGFREVVMRAPGRYELSLLNNSTHPSIDFLLEALHPLIPTLLGAHEWRELKLCHLSLVVSTPGSPDQSWHADGGHVSLTEHLPCHVANIFIPLQDVPLELGPTEFRPGTHVYTRNLAPMMLAARARKQLRMPVAPALQLGDVLLFDYRVLHRGRANLSSSTSTTTTTTSNRTILVLTYSKPWYKDICNFPKRSLFDTKQQQQIESETSNIEEEKGV